MNGKTPNPWGRNRLIKLLLIPAFLSICGCSGWSFYEIESTKQSLLSNEYNSPYITESDSYRQSLPNIRTVAIDAPAECEKQNTKYGQNAPTAFGDCLQEVFLLERSLVKEGYKVISWKQVRSHSRKNKSTPLAAARALNIDVLFTVNIYTDQVSTRDSGIWNQTYYLSNKRGVRGRQVTLERHWRLEQAIELARGYEQMLWTKEDSVPGTHLSASAISTDTGNTFWYYDWLMDAADTEDHGRTAYTTKWACDRTGDCKRWGTRDERRRLKRSSNYFVISQNSNPKYLGSTGTRPVKKRLIEDFAARFATRSDLKNGSNGFQPSYDKLDYDSDTGRGTLAVYGKGIEARPWMIKRIEDIASSKNILLKAGETPKRGYYVILDETIAGNIFTIDFEVMY